jgi:hypothetical protein
MNIDQRALRARFIVEPLMIDLCSCDPEPEQADDGLHDDDGCRDGRN